MTLKNGYLLHDRYRILDILGQGVSGFAYRAVDEKLDISVAIKECVNCLGEDYQQFQTAAKVLSSLRHPNISGVFDYFFIEGQGQYLVNEFFEGGGLQQWMLAEETPTEMEGLQIGIAICNALIYLHNQDPPILHCGIKPSAIKFSTFGEIILVDTGIINPATVNQIEFFSFTRSAPGFFPPEQLGGGILDERSDIFSLGATLYAALAGFPPENSLDRATGKIQLSPLQSYQPSLTSPTVEVIEKALNLRFEDRWQSAAEMKDALIAARDALSPEQQQESRLPSPDLNPTSISPYRRMPEKSDRSLVGWIKNKIRVLQRDPVWYFYAVVVLVLGILFGITLLRPRGLQNIFFVEEPHTATKVVSNLPVATVEPPRPTDTMAVLETATPQKEEIIVKAIETDISPLPTPRGGGVGRLAFVSERSGIPQIFVIDVDSGELTQVTDLDDGACQPDWSPTGEKIVFTSPCTAKRTRYPGSRLMLVEVESGALTPLPASLEGDFDPAWSPDGEWIAHTTLINGRPQIVKLKLSDLKTIRLSEGDFPDSAPAWSPDGKQLAFVRVRGVSQIWLMDANGKNKVQFTRSGIIDNSNPAWHYDGSIILFSQSLREGSPLKQLYGMRFEDIDKHEEYPIIPRIRLDYIPLMDHVDVSPDGYWLAFDHWFFDLLQDIYIMTFPGANLTQITDHPSRDYDPVWSP